MSGNGCKLCHQPLRAGCLLAGVEYVVPWESIYMLDLTGFSGYFFPTGCVKHESDDPKKAITVQLLFYSYNEQINLRLKKNDTVTNEFVVELDVIHTARKSNDRSFPLERSQWPAPEPAINKVVPGSDIVNEFQVVALSRSTTRCFTVRMKLFALEAPAACSLPRSLAVARRDGTLCDVTIEVGGKKFEAHKVVLCAASSVFERMFASGSDFKEKKDNRVSIKEVSGEAFSKFLQFLYVEEIDDWGDCEVELLWLADQYMVDRLKQECRLRLWQLDGVRALRVLLRADKQAVVTGGMTWRMARLAAADWPVASAAPEWAQLQEENPALAEIVAAVAAGDCTSTVFPAA